MGFSDFFSSILFQIKKVLELSYVSQSDINLLIININTNESINIGDYYTYNKNILPIKVYSQYLDDFINQNLNPVFEYNAE